MNKLLIYFFLVLIYLGCSEKQQSEQTRETQKKTIKFVLNDGKKWQMDQHTRNAIQNLDSLLTFNEPIKSIEGSKLFAEKLDEELILLIRGCTMEGPAHDQLHVFLGYFYPMVQELKKEENLESSQNMHSKMKEIFIQYHQYFE